MKSVNGLVYIQTDNLKDVGITIQSLDRISSLGWMDMVEGTDVQAHV